MDTLIIKAIEEGREGLRRLLGNKQIQELAKAYSLNEEAKSRIRGLHFQEAHPFFMIKEDWINIEPASCLGRSILQFDDETIKWFLILYCISINNILLKERILVNLSPAVPLQNALYEVEQNDILNLCDATQEQRNKLVDGIIDVDFFVQKKYPEYNGLKYIPKDYRNNSYDENVIHYYYRLGISQFLLTAGYHYYHGTEKVPDEFLSRGVGMPFVLSSAMYVSIITGEDFYRILRRILVNQGKDECFDDVLAIVENNIKQRELERERKHLWALIKENDEKQRQQETAGEIIMSIWGEGIAKDVIDDRIKKCNDKRHRDILYKCEAIIGKRVSFLTRLDLSGLTDSSIETIIKEYGVALSAAEKKDIVTVEDFIDTILRHEDFINAFKLSILSHTHLEAIDVNDLYDIETRITEVEMVFDVDVDRTKVHSLSELQNFISNNNPVLLGIVSLIAEQLGVDPVEVHMESSLYDLGADSLDYVEMIMKAEQQYGVRIPDEVAGGVSTIGDLYQVVLRQKTGNNH